MKMQLLRWNKSKTKNHRAGHKTRASLISDKGLEAANHNRASGARRRMFLTSPLIEQAVTLKISDGVEDQCYGDFSPIDRTGATALHSSVDSRGNFDPAVLQARWVLGGIRPEELPAQAEIALSHGFDGSALRQLVGLSQPSSRDLGSLPESGTLTGEVGQLMI
jgi:hypothetical protein